MQAVSHHHVHDAQVVSAPVHEENEGPIPRSHPSGMFQMLICNPSSPFLSHGLSETESATYQNHTCVIDGSEPSHCSNNHYTHIDCEALLHQRINQTNSILSNFCHVLPRNEEATDDL